MDFDTGNTAHNKQSGQPHTPPSGKADMSTLDILLPWKEKFEPKQAGAVALCVQEAVRSSDFKDRTRVLGPPVDNPFRDVCYTGINKRFSWLLGRNRATAAGYLHHLGSRTPALLEIENRPVIARHIASRRPDIPLLLYLHNDPQEMKAAHSPAERRQLLRDCSAIVCVSEYVRQRFLEGLPTEAGHIVHTVITGIRRPWTRPPEKNKHILFAGRVLPVKGVLELARAAAQVLPRHPDWTLTLVGAPRFSADTPRSHYQQEVEALLKPLDGQARATGFLPHDEVMDLYAGAAIAVVPSTWNEPLGRTAVEALAAGCALVTTDRGGLPEVARGRGIVLTASDPDTLSHELAETLESLINDPQRLALLQSQAWDDYPFTVEAMVQQLDAIKTAVMAR
jgi:glycosyltransferase involved in cell wall biosynthesis